MVAVNAALTSNSRPLPHNLFAPFIIDHSQATCPQWGNVDTGSMVNIVYRDVVQAFPYLQQYRDFFNHMVEGIGGKKVKVTGKLVDVPLYLGAAKYGPPRVYATFYVVDAPGYHWILGLTLLNQVDGVVHCKAKQLHYTACGFPTSV